MIKDAIIKTGIGALNGVYAVMKLFPQKRRVVMLSRQSSEPSADFRLLAGELGARGIEVRILCDRMGKGPLGAARYMAPLLRQMRYLATSRVAVLDSYSIPVSIFPHRKGLTVIQMWHALGAMKKFSKSILDKPEGKSSRIAALMKMHEGYDHIFTSSEKARPAFAEAFGYPPERLTIMSLPRVDLIMDKELGEANRKKILESIPALAGGRENILYAPTLRIGSDMTSAAEALIKAVDIEKYNLIISMHPLTDIDWDRAAADLARDPASAGKLESGRVITGPGFETAELMAAADHVVTDYSAITYDAALKGLPLYFYAFDKDEYMKDREFYLDYDRDMPGPICPDAASVMREIASGRPDDYRRRSLDFADLYIEKKENCTREIADYIERFL